MNLIKLEVLWAGRESPALAGSPCYVWLFRWRPENDKAGIRIDISPYDVLEIRNGMGKKFNPATSFSDFFQESLIFSGATIKEVILGLYKEDNELYYCSYVVITNGGKERKIPCETATSIALAVRFNCPIYMIAKDYCLVSYLFQDSFDELNELKETFLEEAAVEISYQSEFSDEERELKESTPEELKEMLAEALKKENYERAGKIRNELETRKNGNDSQGNL